MFVDAPADVLDQLEGRLRDLLADFSTYGVVCVAALSMKDELHKDDDGEVRPVEDHRFLCDPGGIAHYGLSVLLADFCYEQLYGDEQ